METLESFSSRFVRASGLFVSRYLYLLCLEADPAFHGSLVDTLNLGEKSGHTIQERSTIFDVLSKRDGRCEIYLYGSRVDDALKGGDIDLLVSSEKLTFSDKITALVEIKDILGEQKIDLTIKPFPARHSDPFITEIMKTAVPIAAPSEGSG